MRASLAKLAAVFAGLAVVIPLIVLLFAGPASRAQPHELPIGVVGPAAAAEQVQQQLDARHSGGFTVSGYADQAALERATANREVYGGLIPGPQPRAVIATGASPVVAPLLTQMAGTLAPGATVQVTDVAPPSSDDPRGAGLGAIAIPVFVTGMVLAIATVLFGHLPLVIAAALPVGAAVTGACAVGVAMWIGVLPGGFGAQWLAMSAGILAIAATAAGLISLIGIRGVAPTVLLFLLVGMPLAGVMAPPEFLPRIWSVLGQTLPIGATGTALRSAAFFADGSLIGAGAAASFAVLGTWIVIGYALMVIGAARRRAVAGAPSDNGEVSEKDLPQPATI
ncbi:hypothetical protein GCM10027289_16950 [Tsukamurella serpentis]